MKKRIGALTFKSENPGVPYFVIGHCKRCGLEQSINKHIAEEFSKSHYIKLHLPTALPWYKTLWALIVRLRNLRIEIPREIESENILKISQ